MSVVAVATGILVAVIAAVGITNARTSSHNHVTVSVTTVSVRDRSETRVDTLLLWNRNERVGPIGHAVKSCVKGGSGGILGGGIMSCDLVVSLPLGKVVATGIVHNLRRYTLTITGGTGRYLKAKGPLFVRSVSGDGVRRLTFAV